MNTVEAAIKPNGELHLVEHVPVPSPRRALVTILEEAPTLHNAPLLKEATPTKHWNRAEEDAASAQLQLARSESFTFQSDTIIPRCESGNVIAKASKI